MQNASNDFLGLIAELNCRRIAMVTGARFKRKGTLDVPTVAMKHLLTARKLHARYAKGDNRVSQAEIGEIKDLCQWLVDTHAECHGQDSPKQIEWNDAQMTCIQGVPPTRYIELCAAVQTGALDG